MTPKISRQDLEEALQSYAQLIEVYPDNEAYLKRYADMLLSMGRETTAATALKHLHDLIAKRSPEEANVLAKKHPQIGRLTFSENSFDVEDKHAIAGKIIYESLGKIWLTLHRKTIKEDQALYRSDDLSDSLKVVLEGEVDIYCLGNEGERIFLEKVGPFDVVGEHTFLKPGRVKIDVFAATPQVVFVDVPHKNLHNLIKKNPVLLKLLRQRSLFRAYHQIISTLPIFQVLPAKLNRHLARNLEICRIPAKSYIHTANQPFSGLDIIIAGHACYLASNQDGKKIPLPPLHLHSIVGNLNLKSPDKLEPMELIAKDNVTLARIDYAAVLSVAEAFPPFKESLFKQAEKQQQRLMFDVSRVKK